VPVSRLVPAPRPSLATSALLALLAVLFAAPSARADSPFDGKWTQGPMKEEYSVFKWEKSCDARPVNGSTGGGESISIHAEGDDLSFVGGGRVFKTNQCYDQSLPTLSRESHTRAPSGREWRTRCTTPANDPRHAVINTLVVATSDSHIEIIESGRYELSGGLCTADIKRTRSFDLVARDNVAPAPAAAPTTPPAPAVEPPKPATPSPPPPDPGRCGSPGDPARLEARPSRKLMRAGESYVFRASVLDAAGCSTRTTTTWAADDRAAKALSVDPSGRVSVAADAPEGSFEVVVTAAGKSTRVTVEVTSADRYDSLLQQSGLNDAGENDVASVAMIAAAQIGGTDVLADDGSRRRRAIFLAIIAVLAVALGAVAVVASKRSKRAAALEREAQERYEEKLEAAEARRKEKAAQHAAAMRAHEESVERARRIAAEAPPPPAVAGRMVCPACQREFPAGSAFCPNDANRLVAAPAQPMGAPAPTGSICPACKRGYGPGVKVCPHDREELVPYALYASRQPAAPVSRGKICPTCGGRFDGNVEFCGKDGTALVLLN
jgi:hypothetical protein